MKTFARNKSIHAVLAAAIASASLGLGGVAHAEEISPTGKGIVGGALLGAEVVCSIESFLKIRSGWAYLGGAIVGAGGGAAGGYVIEQSSSDGRVPVYMLAGGLALVIPALVLSLNGMSYVPTDNATEDKAPTGATADPGKAGGSAVTGAPDASGPVTVPAASPTTPPEGAGAGAPATTPAPAPTPPPGGGTTPPLSLLNIRSSGFQIGLPIPEMRPTFSITERRQYGMRDTTEVRVPLFNASF